MPETIELIDSLCYTNTNNDLIKNSQTHKHTFTCYKKSSSSCRFNIPFWPMKKTHILIPLTKNDGRKNKLRHKFNIVRKNLESIDYEDIDSFWKNNNIFSEDDYLNIIRSGIRRPMIFLKRKVNDVWINNFNPWIAKIVNSNMDIQFVVDEYSCASYVAEYVNKTNRGISNLQRDLIELRNKYPDSDYSELFKKVNIQMLNSI